MQLKLPVEDASHVAEARRQCIRIAERAGFNETDAGRVGIVVTELATNLLKHATRGFLIAGLIESDSGHGVQILSLDKGAGIPDLAAATRDGFSTAGSPGTGLGALRRLSDIFQVSTLPGEGTAMLAVLYAQPHPRSRKTPKMGCRIGSQDKARRSVGTLGPRFRKAARPRCLSRTDWDMVTELSRQRKKPSGFSGSKRARRSQKLSRPSMPALRRRAAQPFPSPVSTTNEAW